MLTPLEILRNELTPLLPPGQMPVWARGPGNKANAKLIFPDGALARGSAAVLTDRLKNRRYKLQMGSLKTTVPIDSPQTAAIWLAERL